MNGKIGGSSCRSATLRERTALTYWLYVVSYVSVNRPGSRTNGKSDWKLKQVEEVPVCRQYSYGCRDVDTWSLDVIYSEAS